MPKKTIAIFYGGKSPEHDVSILTALQIIEALDSQIYNILPIYIDKTGSWWTGEELLVRKNYHFSAKVKKKLYQIYIKIGANKNIEFFKSKKSLFTKTEKLSIDLAFPAFHGGQGENGCFQGFCEFAQLPYIGPRTHCATIWMNKTTTKQILKQAQIKTLPELSITKNNLTQIENLAILLKEHHLTFPLCAKPANLGSSIAVYKTHNLAELKVALLAILKLDQEAIIEPFIADLIEYNIAVTKAFNGQIEVSAIESPLKESEYLSFKDKYLNNDNLDNKLSVSFSEGMASSSRNLNPKLSSEQTKFIINTAKAAFAICKGTGVPRIDFLANRKTGEIWLNEINAIAGSLGYYLWEARKNQPINFTELLNSLIAEAMLEAEKNNLNYQDLKAFNAAIFPQN